MAPVYAVGVIVDGSEATVWTSGHHTWKLEAVKEMTRRAARAAKREIVDAACYAAPASLDDREETAQRLEAAFKARGYETRRRHLPTRCNRRESQGRAQFDKWIESHYDDPDEYMKQYR